MNAIGDQFKSVLLIVTEGVASPSDLDRQRRSGYHAACVLYTQPREQQGSSHGNSFISAEDARARVEAYCAAESIPLTSSTSLSSELPPLTLRCVSLNEASDVLQKAFSNEAPISEKAVLFIVLDLTQQTTLNDDCMFHNALGFQQSFASELSLEYDSTPVAQMRRDGQFVAVPVHMYSTAPIVRDCGTQYTNDTAATLSPNKTTLRAIIREAAYKCGYYPKYGA